MSNQHHFLPFKVASNVAQFVNNDPNQLQTKVNIKAHEKNISVEKL
jgi:hypothetical protein